MCLMFNNVDMWRSQQPGRPYVASSAGGRRVSCRKGIKVSSWMQVRTAIWQTDQSQSDGLVFCGGRGGGKNANEAIPDTIE